MRKYFYHSLLIAFIAKLISCYAASSTDKSSLIGNAPSFESIEFLLQQVSHTSIKNRVIPLPNRPTAKLFNQKLVICLKESINKTLIQEKCYDFSLFKFAGTIGAVVEMQFTKVNGSWLLAEVYANFVVYRLLVENVTLHLNPLPTSNLSYTIRYSISNIASMKNLINPEYHLERYIDIESACGLIESESTVGIYDDGIFYSPSKIHRHGNRLDFGLSANLFPSMLEGVVENYEVFSSPRRLLVRKWIEENPNYEIIMSDNEWILDVSGRYSSASIFALENPEDHMSLNTSTYDKAIIHQKADGILYETQQGAEEEHQRFFPKHLISSISYWLPKDRSSLIRGDAYLYLSKPLISNC